MSAEILPFPVPQNIEQLRELEETYSKTEDNSIKTRIVATIREAVETTLKEACPDLRDALYLWDESGPEYKRVFETELKKHTVQVNITQVTNYHIHHGEVIEPTKPQQLSKLTRSFLYDSLAAKLPEVISSTKLDENDKIAFVGHAMQLFPKLRDTFKKDIFEKLLGVDVPSSKAFVALDDNTWQNSESLLAFDHKACELFDRTFNKIHVDNGILREIGKAAAKAEPFDAQKVLER